MRAALLAASIVAALMAGCSGDSADSSKPIDGTPAPVTTTTSLARTGDDPSDTAPCGTEVEPAPGDLHRTLADGGLERTYILHVPPQYDGTAAMPLVLNLHGFGSNARQQASYSRLPEIADREGLIVVTPDGAGTPQRWNNGGYAGEADDVGFIGALLDALEDELCINTTRVYAAGISNGSAMAQRLACEMPGRFAAVAALAALVYPLNCASDEPVPIIAFHGTADACVPYEGGRTACGRGNLPVPAAEASLAEWARHNGCAGEPAQTQASAHVRLIAYGRKNCPAGAEALLYAIEGGGHTWPGSAEVARLGETTHEIDATELIWAFFEAHRGKR